MNAVIPRICLISPLHPSLNPRLVKEADALCEAGYHVSVIAPDFSPWARAADAAYDGRPWRILERPRFGPYAPWTTRLAELTRRGLSSVITRKLGFMNQTLAQAACHPASPLLVAAAQRHKADLYVAHVMPALPAAAIAARVHGTKYAFDAEDFHLGELPEGAAYDVERRIIRAMEKPYLEGCSYVTAASPGIAQAYVDTYGIPLPSTVLNVFPLRQGPPAPLPRGTVSPRPSIYWYSQKIGAHRGLECAVQAIARANVQPHLFLRGTPDPKFIRVLMEAAQSAGVVDRVHILKPELPHFLETLASEYDVGLCSDQGHTANRRIALTNKQFTYLLAGIPILMSNTPAHCDFKQTANKAVQLYEVDNPESLAQAIDSILSNPERLATMRQEAWNLGRTRFNWDIEKGILLRILAEVFSETDRMPDSVK